MQTDAQQYVEDLGQKAKAAARKLATTSDQIRKSIIGHMAAELRARASEIIRANEQDLSQGEKDGLARPLIERLKLDEKKIGKMAVAMEEIAAQTDPVGQTVEGYVRPNGLRIEKRRVPLGVVLFFFESRPNVTTDGAALCIKSGNAVILRGGKEAFHSNQALGSAMQAAMAKVAPELADAVQVMSSTDRALVPKLLKLDRYIDLVVPRGGESLIRAVVAESTIPVVKHYNGNCHVYVDASATGDAEMVKNICVNAKTSYPGGAVCNAVETLLFHQDAAGLIAGTLGALEAAGVEVRGCEATRKLYPSAKAATEEDWWTEYLAPIVAVKVVGSRQEAIDHINHYGSHHTDAILARDTFAIDDFVGQVDSASVMINASTRFADGGEYGLGAELGISTDKLHARGPMGATDLTTFKWVVTGKGHCR